MTHEHIYIMPNALSKTTENHRESTSTEQRLSCASNEWSSPVQCQGIVETQSILLLTCFSVQQNSS